MAGFFFSPTKRIYKGRLLTKILTSKELSTPSKFLSIKVAQTLRSGGCQFGELLAAWWWVCDVNALNLSLFNRSKLLVSSFHNCTRSHDHNKHNPKQTKKSVEWFNLSANVRLSAFTSRTHNQAARISPRWWLPDLEFWATLDKNFMRLESSLEVEISVNNLPFWTSPLTNHLFWLDLPKKHTDKNYNFFPKPWANPFETFQFFGLF